MVGQEIQWEDAAQMWFHNVAVACAAQPIESIPASAPPSPCLPQQCGGALVGVVDGRFVEARFAGHGEIAARVGTRVPLPGYLQGKRWLNNQGMVRMVVGPDWVETWLVAREAGDVPGLLEQAVERAVVSEETVLGRWRDLARAFGLGFSVADDSGVVFRIGGERSGDRIALCGRVDDGELTLQIEARPREQTDGRPAPHRLRRFGLARWDGEAWIIALGSGGQARVERALGTIQAMLSDSAQGSHVR